VDADRFLTYSLQDQRLTRILAASIDAVEPGRIVRQKLEEITPTPYHRLYLLGIGKAAEPMTMAAASFFNDFTNALIITKQSTRTINENRLSRISGKVTIIESGHPVPDARSLTAGQAVLDFISDVKKNDLLICLISGGGSALVAAPCNGLSLGDIQLLTSSMLTHGANIEELNIIRCLCDRLKGGGLARATEGKIISLILSDVIGDNLEVIASGPTVPSLNTDQKISVILGKYKIPKLISSAKLSTITSRLIFDYTFIDRVNNILIANNDFALRAAKKQAIAEGFFTEVINTQLQGEAYLAGKKLADTLRQDLKQKPRPICLISGGETTVTIHGNGKGGRNQELALGAVEIMDNAKKAMLVSLATDGNDGPTDAAGAVVSGETNQRAKQLGMSASEYLSRNDSFPFFEALGDLLKPGYTGTNVNDLIFLFGL